MPGDPSTIDKVERAGYRWAVNVGIGAVFGLALLYIVYRVLLQDLYAIAQDVMAVKGQNNSIIQMQIDAGTDFNDLKLNLLDGQQEQTEILEDTREINRGTCYGIHKTFDAQQKYCNP